MLDWINGLTGSITSLPIIETINADITESSLRCY